MNLKLDWQSSVGIAESAWLVNAHEIFWSLSAIWTLSFNGDDENEGRSVLHTIYRILGSLICEYPVEYRPEDGLLQLANLPKWNRYYHAADNRLVAIDYWYFMNEIFSITKMSFFRFLNSGMSTLWVLSGYSHPFSLRAVLLSTKLAGVALTREFLYEKAK